jgi:hypothetical protein
MRRWPMSPRSTTWTGERPSASSSAPWNSTRTPRRSTSFAVGTCSRKDG